MRTTFQRPQQMLSALAAAALVVLAACGGGGGSGSTSTGAGPMAVSGTITGFGSVIIDGVRYGDGRARVAIDTDPAAPKSATLADLKLGMQVEAHVADGQLVDVTVHASLVGPIGSIDLASGRFVVYGQTVTVVADGATPTLFDGATGLADLAPGDLVEVHGSVDANHALTATRIERKPRSELAQGVRLGGVVTGLDAAARTFRFNDMTVDFSAASVLPAGTTLADGQLVVAVGDTPPDGTGFHPKAIKVVTADNGAEFGIGGRVMSFTSLADFVVSGVHVDASAATLDGGVAADVAAGVIVAAEGTVVDGVLKASKLRILKAPADVQASLSGQISDWVSASSFTVRGTTVDASAASFEGGSAADLGNGAWVRVSGSVQGDVLKATRIVFQTPPAAQPVRLTGELRDWDAATRRFHFLGVNLHLADSAELIGGALEQMVNGRRVEVRGTPDADGVVQVTRLEFLGDLAPAPAVVGGRLYDLVDGGFKLPGMAVSYSADTVFDGGSAADLANGRLVLVKGRFDAATRTVVASWIEIVGADADRPRVAGTVSAVTSAADVLIGTQRIDASSAEFVDGSAADLVPGAVVEAVGTIAVRDGGNVLVASRLRFLVK